MSVIIIVIILYIVFLGLGNTENPDVNSTDEELIDPKNNISNRELKELKKRQAQAQADRDLECMLMADLLDDED